MLRTITIFILAMAFTVSVNAQGLSGTYTIGTDENAPDTERNFTSLKAAADELNSEGVEDDVHFYITGDLVESENVFIGVDTNGHTVRFKPYEDTTPIVMFTSTSSNEDINGALVIGASEDSWDALTPTANIIFDGSNTEDGNTRDLTLETSPDAHGTNYFRVVGPVDNTQFKNLKVNIGNESFEAFLLSSVGDDENGSMVPTNILFENSEISNDSRSSARAISLRDVFDEVTERPRVTIRNNEILGRRYGVWVREAGGDINIYGNNISVNEQNTLAAHGILIDENVSEQSVMNIHSNQFGALATNGEVYAINVRGTGTANIYNNFITNFITNAESTDDGVWFYGILIRQPDDPDFNDQIFANVYHNTVYMNEVEYTGGEGWRYRGIQMNSNARINADVRNNIVINADQNEEVTSYSLFRFGGAGSWDSDYNNVFATFPEEDQNTYLAFWDGESFTTLGGWQSASGSGENSVSINVEFENAEEGDLRLTGTSITENDLLALPLELVTTDIDGNERSTEATFMGAHEPDDDPVSTEGFISENPERHTLHQNYPNPFNPTTNIQFELTESAEAQLLVYDISGRQISELVNGRFEAGVHNVSWDASQLSSGVYIAVLVAGDVRVHQKMTLIK